MISICNSLSCYIPCLIPFKSILIHKDTHKLCNCYSWMCIIKLESNLLINVLNIPIIH